jgi:hypothetical protein
MSRIYGIPNTNVTYVHHPRVAVAAEPKVEAVSITLVEPEVVKEVPVEKKIPEVPVEKKCVPPVFTLTVQAPESVVNHPPPLPTVLLPIHDVVSSLVPVQQSISRSPSPQPQAQKEEEVVMRIKRRTGPGNVRP